MDHNFIIVCADKRLDDHAATLKALLEQHGHEVDRWTEKQFKAVRASIAQDYQDDKFVILGSDSLADSPSVGPISSLAATSAGKATFA